VHCFCVCSGSALLGDLFGISRSVERDFLSILCIYRRIFLSVLFVLSAIRDVLLFLSILILCSCSKVNDLTSASEMAFKFIQLHYVG